MKRFWLVISVVFLIATSCCTVRAEEWTVASIYYQSNAKLITFTFANNVLSLNTNHISGYVFSMAYYREHTTLFAGDWAVCGYVDGDGALHRDPYATFVYNANRDGGYVQWTNRPAAYGTHLLLGYDFPGNGAATYTGWDQYPFGGEMTRFPRAPVTGSLVLHTYYVDAPYSASGNVYTALKHSFAVPEPSSILALVSGLLGLAALKRRG